MKTRTRSLIVAAAAALVATGLGASDGAAAPRAAPGNINVITHNLEKEGTSLTAVIKRAEASNGPEVLLLQEVCRSMLDRLADDGRGGMRVVAFHARRSHPTDCNKGDIGEAVVYTGSAANAEPQSIDFGVGGDQNYGMACLRFRHDGRRTVACSTHLPAGRDAADDALRSASTARINELTEPIIADSDVLIVGGDFNTKPKTATMDAIYGDGKDAVGRFREVHQMATGTVERDGKVTISKDGGSKFDYIFVAKADSRENGGTEKTCRKDRCTPVATTSNHWMLWGLVPLS
jgi:endonuclease/exonuclease/phosphatase family metal-dependent hydrolase